MKKAIVFVAVCILLLCCTVYGASGDTLGVYYATDIKTTLNGTEISAINIGGRTLISAEDMQYFGFNVWWDGEERTLRLYEHGDEKHEEYSIEKNQKAPSGTPLGNYYETDIVTYIDKSAVTSYNIGGRTYILSEELEKFGFDVIWSGKERTLEIISPKKGGYVYDITLSSGKAQTEEGTGTFSVRYDKGELYGTGDFEYLDLAMHSSGTEYTFSIAFYQNAGLFYSTALQEALKPLCYDGFGVLNPCDKSEKYDEVNNAVTIIINGVKAEKVSVISGAGNGHRDFYFTVHDIPKLKLSEVYEIEFNLKNKNI